MEPTPPPLPTAATIPPLQPPVPTRALRSGFALIILGVLMLGGVSWLDRQATRNGPWSGAILSTEGDAPWEGTLSIRARRLPLENYPLRLKLFTELRKSISRNELRAIGIERTDWLIVVYAPAEQLRPLLASGRLPRPGYPEVLAGAFTTMHEIDADDGHFQVVGRLKRNVSGLATAYVMPADETWEPLFERTTTWGWLDPQGKQKLAKMNAAEASKIKGEIYGGIFPVEPLSAWLSLWALVFVAVGGARVHRVAFRYVHEGVFAPACGAFGAHPRLVRSMHVAMYGGLFASMIVALLVPQINVAVMNYVAHAFSDGNLGYVGRAYQSGNVLSAAAMTWVNNYLLQTVVLTVCASIVVPCIGLLKTYASFALVGLAMTPIWSGLAASYTFHSITMVLELEAYIYACAAVAIFWMRLIGAVRHRDRHLAVDGLRMLGSATLLAGVMLGIAGLYEAATLIFLR